MGVWIVAWVRLAMADACVQADILTVDLSLYDTKRDELIDTVRTALQRDGFFYVIGHGIPQETVRIPSPPNLLEVSSISPSSTANSTLASTPSTASPAQRRRSTAR